ncbi:MAG: amidohydrolase family protein [Gemmatimonadota bacterium]
MISVASRTRSSAPRRLLPMLVVGNGIVGGMEEYVLSLVRHFRAVGQRVLVAAPFVGEFTAALFEQGHPARDLQILDMSDRIDVGALSELSTFLRARRVSLVHTHLQPADTLGAAAAAHAGVPCLSTLHGLYRCKEELLLRDLYGLRYVAVSEAGRASAIAKGLPPEAVGVIPNGVDAVRFDPAAYDREAARRALGIRSDEVLVTSVSRLSREKSPEGFLRAAEIAAAAEPRLRFALVGTGPLESKLRQLLAASAFGSRVRLLGARSDIPEILAASDVAALASRTESLPFCVLEAMAMELPVVAHDVGGVGEALRDGREGFLLPFGRAKGFAARLVSLAGDAALRRKLGSAGRARILERFDFRATTQALLELYANLTEPTAQVPSASLTELVSVRRRSANGSGSGRPAAADRAPEVRAEAPPAVVDNHLHLSGGETTQEVLATLDAAGVAAACLIGPFLDTAGDWVPVTGDALTRANEALLGVVRGAPQRLWGLVTVDPREPTAPRRVLEYAEREGVRGLKLIPHGWNPEDPAALDVYGACEEAGLPILFHSGIFISGRASNACRPARYESVRRFPRLRVVLAHMGWPWVDEAIAVAFMDPLKGRAPQISLDLSPGTPPVYRRAALRKAFAVLGAEALIFGSDRFFPVGAATIRERIAQDEALLRALGARPEDLQRIFHDNAADLFGPAAAAPTMPAPECDGGSGRERAHLESGSEARP